MNVTFREFLNSDDRAANFTQCLMTDFSVDLPFISDEVRNGQYVAEGINNTKFDDLTGFDLTTLQANNWEQTRKMAHPGYTYKFGFIFFNDDVPNYQGLSDAIRGEATVKEPFGELNQFERCASLGAVNLYNTIAKSGSTANAEFRPLAVNKAIAGGDDVIQKVHEKHPDYLPVLDQAIFSRRINLIDFSLGK
jgi:hypothetical protein